MVLLSDVGFFFFNSSEITGRFQRYHSFSVYFGLEVCISSAKAIAILVIWGSSRTTAREPLLEHRDTQSLC